MFLGYFRVDTPYVELVAVMAKYNPFAEKAGMQKIVEQPPPKEVLAIAEILQKLIFRQLLYLFQLREGFRVDKSFSTLTVNFIHSIKKLLTLSSPFSLSLF